MRRTRALVLRGSFCSRTRACGLFNGVLCSVNRCTRTLRCCGGTVGSGRTTRASSVICTRLKCTHVLVRRGGRPRTVLLLGRKVTVSCTHIGTVRHGRLCRGLSAYCRRLRRCRSTLGCCGVFHLRGSDLFGGSGRESLDRVQFGCSSRQRRGLVGRDGLSMVRGRRHVRRRAFVLVVVIVILKLLCCLCRHGGGLCLDVIGRGRRTVGERARLGHHVGRLRAGTPSVISASRGCTSSSLASRGDLRLFHALRHVVERRGVCGSGFVAGSGMTRVLKAGHACLSHVVGRRSGLSFARCMGHFHVRRTVHLLSSPGGRAPLGTVSARLKFGSVSAFCGLFRSSIKVAPSRCEGGIVRLRGRR